jgi:cytochrome c2
MTIRIILFVLCVAAIASFGLLTQARAESVTIYNYQVQEAPSGHFCWGLIGCLVAHALDEQDRRTVGPHVCNVWNGHAYVPAMCAP